MLHKDYRETFRNKCVGILGNGHLGSNLFKKLAEDAQDLNIKLLLFTRANLHQLGEHEFDYFFNCAGTTGSFRKRILETAEENVSLPIFLLRALRVRESLTVLSSSRIYGFHPSKDTVIDESFQHFLPHLSLDFIYDGSKKLMESIYFNYQEAVPYKILQLRLANVYGRFQPAQLDDSTFLKELIRHYADKTVAEIRHNPESSKDYLYIDDAIDGLLRAASLAPESGCFNIAAGKSFSIQDWVNFLGLKASYCEDYPPPSHCSLSIEKAGRILNFAPDPSLHSLKELVAAPSIATANI
jgi:nucleoside-diphosphate-sugar epimerase